MSNPDRMRTIRIMTETPPATPSMLDPMRYSTDITPATNPTAKMMIVITKMTMSGTPFSLTEFMMDDQTVEKVELTPLTKT